MNAKEAAELAAAAVRYQVGDYKRHEDGYLTTSGQLMYECDVKRLADAYLSHVVEQQRQREEEAKPIDEAWLRSVGFDEHAKANFLAKEVFHKCEYGTVLISLGADMSDVSITQKSDCVIMPITTRVQLTALLKALKGNP